MSKNTHLEHLEDSILLDGKDGATDAFVFLDELAKTFSAGGNNNLKITNGIEIHPNQKPITANNFASPNPIPSLFLICL